MLKPELLSPAGNLTKLKIALEYGADAVYASVASFSLRTRSAREFNLESFKEAIEYTHRVAKTPPANDIGDEARCLYRRDSGRDEPS